MNKKIKSGVLAAIGYFLSPFSFWNDLFLNVPIAYLIGFLVGLIYRPLFLPATIIGYWLTNISGLVLFHYGLIDIITKTKISYTKKDLVKDLVLSIIYTFIIVILIKFNILKFPLDYFKN